MRLIKIFLTHWLEKISGTHFPTNGQEALCESHKMNSNHEYK